MNHDLDYYRAIQGSNGMTTAKETEIRLIKGELLRDFENSLDCEDVKINGVDSKLLITKAADATIKNVVSKPDETVYLGDIVNWCSTDWIVDTIDADNRITNRGKMRRCNITLKWLDEGNVVRSYPGFCEDATKYSDGVAGGKMMQIGEFQIKVKVHLDEHSAKINRDKRFLLDVVQFLPQMESTGSHPSAYIVTRRNVLTGFHNGHGFVELTMAETAYSENDNPTLMLADYYSPDDVYAITISNADENLTVAKGANYTLSCSATKNGVALDQTSILFRSSNTAIATVSTTGKIKGIANGICIVTIKAGNARSDILVTIEDALTTATIKIFADDTTVVYGQNKIVKFAAYQNGIEVNATFNTSLNCASTIASISDSGSNYVVISVPDNDALIGATITLTVSSVALSAFATQILTIVGWF